MAPSNRRRCFHALCGVREDALFSPTMEIFIAQRASAGSILFPSRRDRVFEGSMPVAGKCDVCGKAKTFGNNVSFSKRRTSRDFRPNVHKKRIIVNGVGLRLNICTRCQRSLGKAGKVA